MCRNQYILLNKDIPVMTFSLTEADGVYFYGDVSAMGSYRLGLKTFLNGFQNAL